VAANCSVPPTVSIGFAGPTAIDTNVGATFTVKLAVPETVPDVAVIVAVPVATPVASPPETVAKAVFDEVQVAEAVKSCVLLSLKVPVAVNCCVAPALIVAVAGVTAIELNVAAALDPELHPGSIETIETTSTAIRTWKAEWGQRLTRLGIDFSLMCFYVSLSGRTAFRGPSNQGKRKSSRKISPIQWMSRTKSVTTSGASNLFVEAG
jgi:hypothetical protein